MTQPRPGTVGKPLRGRLNGLTADADSGVSGALVEAVEEGIALLDEGEQRRIVESWVTDYPDRWQAAFVPCEGGAFRSAPADALAFLVPPLAVWSMDEAMDEAMVAATSTPACDDTDGRAGAGSAAPGAAPSACPI